VKSTKKKYANESPEARAHRFARMKEYRAKNLERLRQHDRLYYRRVRRADPEIIKRDNERGRKYYYAHKEEVHARTKRWQSKNRDKTNAYTQKWVRNNRERHRATKNKRERLKRLNDPLYRFICRMRISVHKRLADFKLRKRNKSSELHGCDTKTLVAFVESQFEPGMSWKNRGKAWHLDHVVPLKLFNLENKDELLAAFHFSNLRPTWTLDNLRKGSSIRAEVIRSQLTLISHSGLKSKAEELLAQC